MNARLAFLRMRQRRARPADDSDVDEIIGTMKSVWGAMLDDWLRRHSTAVIGCSAVVMIVCTVLA